MYVKRLGMGSWRALMGQIGKAQSTIARQLACKLRLRPDICDTACHRITHGDLDRCHSDNRRPRRSLL